MLDVIVSFHDDSGVQEKTNAVFYLCIYLEKTYRVCGTCTDYTHIHLTAFFPGQPG